MNQNENIFRIHTRVELNIYTLVSDLNYLSLLKYSDVSRVLACFVYASQNRITLSMFSFDESVQNNS